MSKKHGTIDGSVFHYDVPTKCSAVKNFLKQAKQLNKYTSKKKHAEAIAKIYAQIADEYMVTVPSIKAWVRKYYIIHIKTTSMYLKALCVSLMYWFKKKTLLRPRNS